MSFRLHEHQMLMQKQIKAGQNLFSCTYIRHFIEHNCTIPIRVRLTNVTAIHDISDINN
jgi:hypothetical protein